LAHSRKLETAQYIDSVNRNECVVIPTGAMHRSVVVSIVLMCPAVWVLRTSTQAVSSRQRRSQSCYWWVITWQG